jgi:hypothetical protein
MAGPSLPTPADCCCGRWKPRPAFFGDSPRVHDHRDPERVEHSVPELLAQRVFALALGYEDLNDHDTLRHDPLLAVLVGKADPTGQERRRREDRGKSLAGKSTLNRLELTPVGANEKSRYKKVVARHHDIELLCGNFWRCM